MSACAYKNLIIHGCLQNLDSELMEVGGGYVELHSPAFLAPSMQSWL